MVSRPSAYFFALTPPSTASISEGKPNEIDAIARTTPLLEAECEYRQSEDVVTALFTQHLGASSAAALKDLVHLSQEWRAHFASGAEV